MDTNEPAGEPVHIVGTALIEHQNSLKATLRVYAFRLGVPTAPDEVDDLWSALADRALHNADGCTPDKVPLAWLKVMALHLVQERRRHLDKIRPFSQMPQAEPDEEGQARSQIEIFDALRGRHVPSADPASTCGASLDELLPFVPAAYHEILRASITQGLEAPAIAARTGQNIGAVYTQICRARRALRAAWNRWQSEI